MKGAVEIEDLARRLRIDSVQMLAHAGSGHLGGCLSSADIMAVLYGLRMRINPGNPDWAERVLYYRLVMLRQCITRHWQNADFSRKRSCLRCGF